MMAMADSASADGIVACFDAKYHYLLWRPVHAVRRADTDGNPSTEPDSTWTPLLVTPNHPEYPSAHACSTGAVMQAMSAFFGSQHVSFSLDSTVTNTTRYYARFKDVIAEVGNARVWAGIHFRNSTKDGAKIGRKVGNWMSERYFLPCGC
jgi:hypothetical protein